MARKVFISSTTNLSDERRTLRTIIQGLGHEPILWDDYGLGARGATTEELCLETISDCHFLIAVCGTNPGWPSSQPRWSVFHREVLHARNLGIPYLVFYTEELRATLALTQEPERIVPLRPSLRRFDKELKSHVKPPTVIYPFADEDQIAVVVRNFVNKSLESAHDEHLKRQRFLRIRNKPSGALHKGTLPARSAINQDTQPSKSVSDYSKLLEGIFSTRDSTK